MKAMSLVFCLSVLYFLPFKGAGQELLVGDPWLSLNAAAEDPLYTTYNGPVTSLWG